MIVAASTAKPRGLIGTAGHHHCADVLGLEDPEGGPLEVVGEVHQLEAEAQIGLVGTEPAHRLRVGHVRDLADLDTEDPLPDPSDDRLPHVEHIRLIDQDRYRARSIYSWKDGELELAETHHEIRVEGAGVPLAG